VIDGCGFDLWKIAQQIGGIEFLFDDAFAAEEASIRDVVPFRD
jgi:hypothetical protein